MMAMNISTQPLLPIGLLRPPPCSLLYLTSNMQVAPLLTCTFLTILLLASLHPEWGGQHITWHYYLMSIVNEPSGESNSNLNVKPGLMTCRFTAQKLAILSEVLELPNPLITTYQCTLVSHEQKCPSIASHYKGLQGFIT